MLRLAKKKTGNQVTSIRGRSRSEADHFRNWLPGTDGGTTLSLVPAVSVPAHLLGSTYGLKNELGYWTNEIEDIIIQRDLKSQRYKKKGKKLCYSPGDACSIARSQWVYKVTKFVQGSQISQIWLPEANLAALR